MPDEITEKIIEELANQLPVKDIYDDIGSPAAREAGELFSDIMKVIKLALAPIQFGAALQDRYRSFLNESVRRVPDQNRISPQPQILGPTIEAIRYEPEGTRIDEMFSRLLSSSMDSSRVSYAHPAFPGLIRQLSPDEAQLITLMHERDRHVVNESPLDISKNWFYETKIVESDIPVDGLEFPEQFAAYIGHLNALGLVEIVGEKQSLPLYGKVNGANVQNGIRNFLLYRLTTWGRTFAVACTHTEGGSPFTP